MFNYTFRYKSTLWKLSNIISQLDNADGPKKMIQMQNRWNQHEQKQLDDPFFVPNRSQILLTSCYIQDGKELVGNTLSEEKKLFNMWARMKKI